MGSFSLTRLAVAVGVLFCAQPVIAESYAAGGGTATGSNSISIGSKASSSATVSSAIGYQATARGDYATALGSAAAASGKSASAVGNAASASEEESVAVGYNSLATAKHASAFGAEAHAQAEEATAVGYNAAAYGYESSSFGSGSFASGTTATAIGHFSQATEENAVALGAYAYSHAEDSVAIGSGATTNVKGSVALGPSSTTSRGAGISGYLAEGKTSSTWVSSAGEISIGRDSYTRQITNLAAGSEDTDAVNVAQLKAVNEVAKKHNTVVAGNNIAVTQGSNADGGIEYTVSTAEDVSFSSVTVGGASITQSGIRAGGQKITNVAAGEVSATSTDAVNGSQLYQVQQGINQNSAGIGNLVNRVNDLDDQIDKVGAASAALAALHPVDFDPDHRFQMSVGLGHYKSRDGVAVGAFWYPTDTGNLLLSVGYAASASDNRMVNAGLTYRFGGAPKTSSQDMRARYEAVTAENRDLSAGLKAMTAQNQSMQQEILRIKAAIGLK